ncbi:endo-1,4-beta-xylanase [Caulobacter sp. RHG1]|uniref:endo-1,4-beta-xylanase n=1 Tax=Caulobacter sp. (strain RHG1) TaxID=2545762 RepID=UPI001553CB26|nr:endo-1,4-beta-xylanase [Caulobacter sp. RHG1]NQE61685.1 Endo-1,4-beta-xylanase [Caulobacter sp. RHG1]
MTRLGLSRRAALASGLALTAAPTWAAERSLRDLAAAKGVLFGAAIEPHVVQDDPAFADLLQRHCGSLTAENAMKWNALRPTPDRFDFAAADATVAFARRQGAQVYGHALVWHEAMPAWLDEALTPRTAGALLSDHIRRVAGRYAGSVTAWDVVNEVVERNDGRRDGLRLSPWFRALGPSYIGAAFRAARQAAPRARLALADYGLEYDDERWMVEKRGTMLSLLEDLKAAGVPIHALAIQGHLDGARRPAFGAGLRRFLAQVANLGLEIYITELDVNDQKVPGNVARRDVVVADSYRAFLDVVLDEPAVRRVTTWGLTDRHTSKSGMFPRADRAGVRPLPFDAALRPKLAYQALVDAFAGAPRR